MSLRLKIKIFPGLNFLTFQNGLIFMFLSSTERGADRQEYLYGNDSQGPFYLKYTPVVIGSERVYLDGVLQQRDQDYYIENKSGKITFRNNVVQTHQIIKVLYENEDQNIQSRYTALRYRYDFGWLLLGITGLQKRDIQNDSALAEVDLQEKRIYGLDAKVKFGYLLLELEGARSQVIENIADRHSTENIADAQFARVSYNDQKQLQFYASDKKTDPKYEAIGNVDLPRGLHENTAGLEI
jgi:antitoxin component YwqK of YwqJK toxin-antitoxin module